MLMASSYACDIGIKLYSLVTSLSSFSTNNPIGQFAKYFPSSSGDSKLASSWFATDALLETLNPGAIVAPADQFYVGTSNPGSVLTNDRTVDSNVYLMFIGMAAIGTSLNRYGAPTGTYNQGTALPWETMALVKADTSGAACALASGFLNFIDGAADAVLYLASSSASTINTVVAQLKQEVFTTDTVRATYGGNAHCINDGFSQSQCTAALLRLRYRGACAEQDAAASVAAGIIGAVNDVWL